MKKTLKDFTVTAITRYAGSTALIALSPDDGLLPDMLPGQFVNILVPGCREAFLRRPVSICDVDADARLLYLFIKNIGKGTARLCSASRGEQWSILLPLGNGFRIDAPQLPERPLLIGGGVGVAPLYYLGRCLLRKGVKPAFLLGGATESDLPLLPRFSELGDTYVTTADGSCGVKGFVTDHPLLDSGRFDKFYCCGPTPMMKAVGALALRLGCGCEVSLENRMACGLGACLCCVEDTKEGNRCVCTDGPVFDINELNW